MDENYYRRFPMYVCLEVSSLCNSRCVHCPNGAKLLQKEYKGLMDETMALDILHEVAEIKEKHEEFQPSIVLYGNGEPLLHKKLNMFIQTAFSLGLSSNLSTNCINLKPEHGEILSKAGLNIIKLSIWGDNKEEYESRCRQKFDETIRKVIQFIENCDDRLGIEINVVKFRNEDEPIPYVKHNFLKLFTQFKSKNIDVYGQCGSDWAGQLPIEGLTENFDISQLNYEPCSHFRDNMLIAYDGTVMFCWLDFNRNTVYGKYEKGNLLELWQAKARQKVYNLMEAGRFSELFPCRQCTAPYTLTKKPRCFYKLDKNGNFSLEVLNIHSFHYHNYLKGQELPGYIKNVQELK